MATVLHPEVATQKDFLSLNGTDHIELYVGNARQAAYFYRLAFGMKLAAYAGPETGARNRSSYVVEQGKIRLVLTTPLRLDGEVAEHIRVHGDGVRDIAMGVDDARQAWKDATRRGARSVREPFELKDGEGTVRIASIAAYGDTIHSFVERGSYRGVFLPGFRAEPEDRLARAVGLQQIDHVVSNVGWNELSRWADFYAMTMGFSASRPFDDRDRSAEYSTLTSRVVVDGGGRVQFAIHEPAGGRSASEVQEYLESYHGPGVQRIALATNDIVYTVARLQQQGVPFVTVPHAYYEELAGRVGRIDEPMADLQRLGILVDRDQEGYLLQAFTRPVGDRPTLCFEVVQRRGSGSFGKGNERVLREARARERAERA